MAHHAAPSPMQQNLRILPWWWVLRWVWLGEGIWVLYLTQERGISLGGVLLFEAVFSAVVICSEVPTGMIADRYGRRASLMVGSVCVVAAFFTFAVSPLLAFLLASYALFGMAETLFSGADSALLFDSLKAEGREHEFTAWNGRLNALIMGATAIFTIVGSIMVRWTPLSVPILLSAALSIPAIVLAWRMHEPPRDDERHSYLQTGRLGLLLVARSAPMRALIVLMAVTTLAISIMAITQQLVIVRHGMPVWTVGLFVAVQMAVGAVGSAFADRLGRRLTLRRTFLWMPLLSALALAAAAFDTIWLYALFIFPAFGWNVMWPHFADYLSMRSPDSLRATAISIASLVTGAANIVIAPLVGLGIDRVGLEPALAVTALLFAVVVVVAYVAWLRTGDLVRRPPEVDAPSAPAVPSSGATEGP